MRILIALMILAATVHAQGMCPGDNNGDGNVTIDEIVASVNSALAGCADPTPTPVPSCDLPLYVDNTRSDACAFTGKLFSSNCGDIPVDFLWVSDGAYVILSAATPQGAELWLGGNIRANRSSVALYEWTNDQFATSGAADMWMYMETPTSITLTNHGRNPPEVYLGRCIIDGGYGTFIGFVGP